MDILSIIAKKRDANKLDKDEIDYFIKEYTNGNITDYQAAALIMAMYINGLDNEETTNLTTAMTNSGDVMDLSEFGNVVDKHSTGGVGDKVSLVLMPTIASLGVKVVKMSGRGLGFTGGTKDKLESIKGYRTEISEEEFINNVRKIGISMIGQTSNLAPADKKIYALRDTISCIESIPLIASSIMSKKIASGANKLMMNVTCGSGAFMKNIEDAKNLSNTMIEIGKLSNKEIVCVITDMNQPLGRMVGNSLEVIETVNALKNGNMEEDLKETVTVIGAYMLKLSAKGENIEENKQKILNEIISGRAYEKFVEMIENQGGSKEYLENLSTENLSKYKIEVKAQQDGYVNSLNAENVGKIAALLGAGRIKKEDIIDYNVGIELNKKIGDYVSKGDVLAIIYANDEQKAKESKEKLEETYIIKDEKPENLKEIISIVY